MTSPGRTIWILFLLLPWLVGPAGATVDSQVQVTGLPISLAGVQNLTLDSGAVHVQDEAVFRTFQLEADRLDLEYAWKRGTVVQAGSGPEPVGTQPEQGGRLPSFENASLAIDTDGDPAEILAYPGEGTTAIEASGTGAHTFDRLDVPYVTAVGESPSTQDAGDTNSVGFWYAPPGGWLIGHQSDQVIVQGDFSLFLNNVTVAVYEDGAEAWTNWTGYQQEDQAPGVHSYERHVLVVHVTNGTLSLAAEDAVDILGARLTVDTTGVVIAHAATGRLQVGDVALAFEDDPLQMEGEGRLHLTEPALSDRLGGLTLGVDQDSSFELRGGERIEPTSTGFPTAPGPMGAWGLVVGLALASVGTVAYRTGAGHQLVQRWRTRRYTKWMTRGRELASGGDYGGAVPCFERATRAQPAKGVAWYHLTIALIEDGRPREVLDVIDEARQGEAIIDELDFLELEAAAAHEVGHRERCRAAVAQLAEGSEAMARSFAHDLEWGEEVLGPELAARLSPGDDDEGLRGYV